MTLGSKTMAIRRSSERGHFDHGWLNTYHTFSFGGYYDPKNSGFRDLLVLNEDRVQPGAGFPRHPHRDMEILSYVVEGGLKHQDSTGTGSIIRPDEIQRMSAGTGITHSEANASDTQAVHFLQIWIVPERRGLQPGYEQKALARVPGLTLLASPDGAGDSVTVRQDVRLYRLLLDANQSQAIEFDSGRYGYVQVVKGALSLLGETLHASDGAALSNPGTVVASSPDGAEVLVFDLS